MSGAGEENYRLSYRTYRNHVERKINMENRNYSLTQGTEAFCEFVETAVCAMRTLPKKEFLEAYESAKNAIPQSLQDEVLIKASLPSYMIKDLIENHGETFKASWEQHDSEVYFEFFKTLLNMPAISEEAFFEAIHTTNAYESIEQIAESMNSRTNSRISREQEHYL